MTSLDLLNPDFQDMVRALVAESAEFLIVGGFAVAFHGHPRTTGDMDLWVRPTVENAANVWRALARFGAPMQALGVQQDDFARSDLVVQFGVPPRRIDLLTSISGIEFEAAWANRVQVPWNGMQVCFLALDDLLCNKRATGRSKDAADVAELEKRRRPRR